MTAEEIGRRISAIREDRERGATQIAREGVMLLAQLAKDPSVPDAHFADLFPRIAHDLARARPAMASLLNGAGRVMAAWVEAGGSSRPAAARAAAAESAHRWIEAQEANAAFIADHTAEVISGTAITLSYSSTVLRALEECWDRGVLKGAIVAESRPLLEGRRTAAALASLGIPTTLIMDAEMGLLAAEADAALVGADTILPDGSLANKAGTLLLALAARRCRVPFYTVAETHKIAPATRRRTPFPHEEREPEEVLPEPITGVTARNLYFDLTPARYITGYITERGLLDHQDVAALAGEAPGLLLSSA